MKVKFRYGIKSYSGTLDELVFAAYEDRNVVIGRELPSGFERQAQHDVIANYSVKLGEFYRGLSEGFKSDLAAYSKQMYNLKAYSKKIAGSGYSVFVKMIWAASKDANSPVDVMSLSVDDISAGAYSMIESVKVAVDNGYLPLVEDYEVYTNTL